MYMRFCRFDKTGAAADVWQTSAAAPVLSNHPNTTLPAQGILDADFFFVNWNEEIRHVSSVGCGTHDHHV